MTRLPAMRYEDFIGPLVARTQQELAESPLMPFRKRYAALLGDTSRFSRDLARSREHDSAARDLDRLLAMRPVAYRLSAEGGPESPVQVDA